MSSCDMIFVGDIMCGDSFYDIGKGVASSMDKFGVEFLPSDISSLFSRQDLVFGNIECALSDKGRKDRSLRTIHMRGRPVAAEYLSRWGVNAVNVANNHILEHGKDSALETVRVLSDSGIKTVGAGSSGTFEDDLQIAELILNNNKVSLIGICLHKGKYAFNGGADENKIIQVISKFALNSGLIIVSVHWGNEYIDRPSYSQKQLARKMIDSGASIVIGHHPHVVQGVERYKKGLIAYSLGNFIFDSFLEDTSWAVMLQVRASGKAIIDYRCIPIEKDKWHRPVLPTENKKNELEKEIQRRCNILKDVLADREFQKKYEYKVRKLEVFARARLCFQLIKSFFFIKPIYWHQILWRPIARRSGKW